MRRTHFFDIPVSRWRVRCGAMNWELVSGKYIWEYLCKPLILRVGWSISGGYDLHLRQRTGFPTGKRKKSDMIFESLRHRSFRKWWANFLGMILIVCFREEWWNSLRRSCSSEWTIENRVAHATYRAAIFQFGESRRKAVKERNGMRVPGSPFFVPESIIET